MQRDRLKDSGPNSRPPNNSCVSHFANEEQKRSFELFSIPDFKKLYRSNEILSTSDWTEWLREMEYRFADENFHSPLFQLAFTDDTYNAISIEAFDSPSNPLFSSKLSDCKNLDEYISQFQDKYHDICGVAKSISMFTRGWINNCLQSHLRSLPGPAPAPSTLARRRIRYGKYEEIREAYYTYVQCLNRIHSSGLANQYQRQLQNIITSITSFIFPQIEEYLGPFTSGFITLMQRHFDGGTITDSILHTVGKSLFHFLKQEGNESYVLFYRKEISQRVLVQLSHLLFHRTMETLFKTIHIPVVSMLPIQLHMNLTLFPDPTEDEVFLRESIFLSTAPDEQMIQMHDWLRYLCKCFLRYQTNFGSHQRLTAETISVLFAVREDQDNFETKHLKMKLNQLGLADIFMAQVRFTEEKEPPRFLNTIPSSSSSLSVSSLTITASTLKSSLSTSSSSSSSLPSPFILPLTRTYIDYNDALVQQEHTNKEIEDFQIYKRDATTALEYLSNLLTRLNQAMEENHDALKDIRAKRKGMTPPTGNFQELLNRYLSSDCDMNSEDENPISTYLNQQYQYFMRLIQEFWNEQYEILYSVSHIESVYQKVTHLYNSLSLSGTEKLRDKLISNRDVNVRRLWFLYGKEMQQYMKSQLVQVSLAPTGLLEIINSPEQFHHFINVEYKSRRKDQKAMLSELTKETIKETESKNESIIQLRLIQYLRAKFQFFEAHLALCFIRVWTCIHGMQRVLEKVNLFATNTKRDIQRHFKNISNQSEFLFLKSVPNYMIQPLSFDEYHILQHFLLKYWSIAFHTHEEDIISYTIVMFLSMCDLLSKDLLHKLKNHYGCTKDFRHSKAHLGEFVAATLVYHQTKKAFEFALMRKSAKLVEIESNVKRNDQESDVEDTEEGWMETTYENKTEDEQPASSPPHEPAISSSQPIPLSIAVRTLFNPLMIPEQQQQPHQKDEEVKVEEGEEKESEDEDDNDDGNDDDEDNGEEEEEFDVYMEKASRQKINEWRSGFLNFLQQIVQTQSTAASSWRFPAWNELGINQPHNCRGFYNFVVHSLLYEDVNSKLWQYC